MAISRSKRTRKSGAPFNSNVSLQMKTTKHIFLNRILILYLGLQIIFFMLSILNHFAGGNFNKHMYFLMYYNIPYLISLQKLQYIPYLTFILLIPHISFVSCYILSILTIKKASLFRNIGIISLILYSLIYTIVYSFLL